MRLALLGAALVAEAVCLWFAGQFGDFTQPGHALQFVPLMLLGGVCFAAAVLWFPRNAGVAPWILWLPCLAFRVLMLPSAPGDDLWRYLWEGRVQNAGFNPYVLSPQAPELTVLRDADWPKINHPHSPAIYPPLAEIALAGLTRISATPLFLKSAFALADVATVALLLSLIGGATRHRNVAWYAWNPAVIHAFAGGGHFDSLMLLALTAAVLLLTRAHSQKSHLFAALSAGALGAAIALKLVPIFLVPVWAFALGRRWYLSAIAIAIPALLTIPYGGPANVLRPLLAFAEVTRFNDLVWGFLESVTLPNPFGRNWPFTLTLALAVVVITWRLRDDWPRAALWVLGAALLLSPVLHPWYATWILPFSVWRRQHAWTVLSLSGLCAYLLWESTALWTAWQPNLLTRALVVVPPLIAWGILASRKNAPHVGSPEFRK